MLSTKNCMRAVHNNYKRRKDIMSVALGTITSLTHTYKIENKSKEQVIVEYTKTCTDAAKLIPIKTLQHILPYSKEELRQAINEDSLLNNLDWDLIWENIMKSIDDPQTPEFAALFAWRCKEDYKYRITEIKEKDKAIAKYTAIPVLKQAIRLYINTPD